MKVRENHVYDNLPEVSDFISVYYEFLKLTVHIDEYDAQLDFKGFIFLFLNIPCNNNRLITFSLIADPCVYNNLEFKGGDLSVIPSLGFEACKNACQKFKGCSFFTINSVACILKDSKVEIHRKSGVLSGATDQTCGK